MTTAAQQNTNGHPLAGVRVLELSGIGPSRYCGMLNAVNAATLSELEAALQRETEGQTA